MKPGAPRILIVKLSSLGDVVHAMPAVQDIVRAFPQAQVDWVVERGFAPLVQRCAGVQRVIACDLRRWRKQPFAAATRQAWREFRAALGAQAYDAVIDLQGLTKSALVARLARTAPLGLRYAMAHATEGSSYEAPTRWVADRAIALAPHVHAVERSRRLCAAALGYTLEGPAQCGLQAKASASTPTSADPSPNSNPTPARPVVALVHGTSRTDKEWPLAHWVALAQRLNAQGYAVALPQASAQELATAQAIAAQVAQAEVWPRMGLDAVCDALARCAGVVGVDSGLSHMAVALGLPHVQIYNLDTAWRTGPHAPTQVSVFAAPAPSPEGVWQAWQQVSSAGAA